MDEKYFIAKIFLTLQKYNLKGQEKFYPRDAQIEDDFLKFLNVYIGPLSRVFFPKSNEYNKIIEPLWLWYYNLIDTSLLSKELNIPVISAGGVGCKADIDKMISYGAEGVSVGSPFIASIEAGVTDEYKKACVDYGAKDIIMTERISGTPCTVINTPYVQKIGTKQTWLESVLNKNKKLSSL